MKMVEATACQITDPKAIMSRMQEIIKAADPNFSEEEEKYRSAAAALEQAVDKSLSPSVDAYLAAQEEAFADKILCIAWQGFQLNLDIFNDPARAVALEADDEDLHRERRLGNLTKLYRAKQTIGAFLTAAREFPQEQQELLDGITGFYAYLETVGYKLAHYFGFRLADRVLPYMVPGYTSDPVIDFRYSERLCYSLGLDPACLE